MRRVKWVVMASRVAMLLRRSWPRVDWRTLIRGEASMEVGEVIASGGAMGEAVVVYIVLMIS